MRASFIQDVSLCMEINSLHAVGYCREHFVWDGVDHVTKDRDGQVLAEDLHLIALLTRDVGDIDHRHIHADITHVLCFLTVD